MHPKVSVIVCTHNPRRDYLCRVLEALNAQTLDLAKWELLLIDNASSQQLASEVDLTWHLNARHVREDQLGLTYARLRGIKEAAADLLIFVDDDNALDIDYLKVALEIAHEWPKIGVWGGQVLPEFEETPPDWTKPYWGSLAIRELDRDKWTNLPNNHEALPCGAGFCVRRVVAQQYAELLYTQPDRLKMGRRGQLLTSGEDTDIALTACDMGLGMGQFKALKLLHLLPAHRLKEDYLLKLKEGMSYSGVMLGYRRGEKHQLTMKDRVLRHIRRQLMDQRTRRFEAAAYRGFIKAFNEISKYPKSEKIAS